MATYLVAFVVGPLVATDTDGTMRSRSGTSGEPIRSMRSRHCVRRSA